jgi:hypothetical protein
MAIQWETGAVGPVAHESMRAAHTRGKRTMPVKLVIGQRANFAEECAWKTNALRSSNQRRLDC